MCSFFLKMYQIFGHSHSVCDHSMSLLWFIGLMAASLTHVRISADIILRDPVKTQLIHLESNTDVFIGLICHGTSREQTASGHKAACQLITFEPLTDCYIDG